MKKLAIIGKGTAGALTALYMSRAMRGVELEWYYDSSIKPQAVGEGANLALPFSLLQLNFEHHQLLEIDGTHKTGIYKRDWNDCDFFHNFEPPNISYHFSAIKLQNFIFDKIKDKFTLYDQKVNSSDIDADFIIDCGGRPESYEDFNTAEYIPVNSVHVTQCPWDYPRFQYTLTIARPYGWVFGIPLANRCSIGYLYNNKINTLDEVKEDAKSVIDNLSLTGASTNSFSFNNYYRKQNFSSDGRIAYNGNASFFLEPLEATSISTMDGVMHLAVAMWKKDPGYTVDYVNSIYTQKILEVQRMIMLHYYAGSRFNTPFWEMAEENGNKCIQEFKHDPKFIKLYNSLLSNDAREKIDYGSWPVGAYGVNLKGLNIRGKFHKIMRDVI